MQRIRHRKLTAIVAIALAVTAGIAFGRSATTTPAAGAWAWSNGVPGAPITPSTVMSGAAERSGVSTASLHTVKSAGVGNRQASILAGSGSNGDVCIAHAGYGYSGAFRCLGGSGPTSPLLDFLTVGGSEPDVVSFATLVGLVRSDVSRLVVTLANGRQVELKLNVWRGFGYAANSADTLPQSIDAYGNDGNLIAHEEVAPTA
jgi:hypothetical protein